MKKHVVLDTNVLLLDANNLVVLGGDDKIIVLPETVLSEMDSKKSGFSEIAYQARAFGRLMASATDIRVTRQETATETNMKVQGIDVLVVALNEYKIDTANDSRNDQKIIAVAKYVEDIGNKVQLVSNDVLMRLRGLAVGLVVTDLKISDKEDYCFVKTLVVDDDEVFRGLHNASIYDIDPDYVLENYSYKFVNLTTNQTKLAVVVNGFISVIGKETEKQLRQQMVAPMNGEQMLVSKAIQDPTVDLVVIEGKAGSGKNITALSNAVKLMKMNRDKYDNIMYVRSPVDDVANSDEEIGFRTGEENKLGVYLGPLDSTVDFLVRNNINMKGKKKSDVDIKVAEGVEKLKDSCSITGKITTGQRGETHHKTILILDEASSMAPATMQKMLSRVGKDCKVIVTGSQNQIDSKFLTRYNNGLAVLMQEASVRNIDTNVNMFAITLEKVVRSDMAGFAEDLFAKGGDNG